MLALVLMGDFNIPDVCWKYITAEEETVQELPGVCGRYLPDTAGE